MKLSLIYINRKTYGKVKMTFNATHRFNISFDQNIHFVNINKAR